MKYHCYTIFIVLLVVLLSCKDTTSTKHNSQTSSNILNVVLTGNPDSLDPQETSATITAQVTNSIYNSFLSLVDSWTVSEDNLEWTFTLIPDVTFHNGVPLSAQDFVATIHRLQDDTRTSPFAKHVSNINTIEALDTLTVKITLSNIDDAMPEILGSNFMAILPASLIEANHSFSTIPVGTGPFIFSSWEDDISIQLLRNDKYYLIPPNIQGVTFFIMPDITTQVQAIIRGDIDVVPYIIEPELSTLQKEKDINIVTFPGSTILVLAMNTQRSPLDTIEFRKAIAKAIDKQKVIDLAYPGSTPTNIFWHSSSEIYTEVPEVFNIQEAKEYFARNPQSTSLSIAVPSIFEPHIRAAQIYQTMLEEVGITTTIKKMDWGIWLDQVYRKGDFDLTVIGHTGKLTPGERLKQYADDGGYVGWENDKFSALITQASYTTDATQRIALYQEALTMMTQEYPFVFIGETTTTFAIDNKIRGLYFDPILETYDFTSIVINNE